MSKKKVKTKTDPRICVRTECGKSFLAFHWLDTKYCSHECYHAESKGVKVNNKLRTLNSYVKEFGEEEGNRKYNERMDINSLHAEKKKDKYMAAITINGKVVRSKEYNSFACMKARCNNPNNPHYKYYGERGIKVLYVNFKEFLDDVGFAPSPDHTIDRKDNSGNYEKGNCKWATKEEQLNNTRMNVKIEYNGSLMSLKDISNLTGMSYQRVQSLIKSGKTVDYIISNCKPNKKQK